MAVFSLKHEGKTLRDLRSIVKYNTVDKKELNTPNNPRLIGIISNCGDCLDYNNKDQYNQLIDNFMMTVESNALLSTNSRQKYLYEHSVVSFSIEDDEKLGIEKATKLAIETAKEYDPDFENTPYLVWPQTDSGKLHFHIVRGFHDDYGKYQKQSYSKKKMTEAAQRIEKKYNLTYTGKNNPENYIFKNGKRIYFPKKHDDNIKIIINKNLEASYKIKDFDNKANKTRSKIKSNNLKIDRINEHYEKKLNSKEGNIFKNQTKIDEIIGLDDFGNRKEQNLYTKVINTLTNKKHTDKVKIDTLESENIKLEKELKKHLSITTEAKNKIYQDSSKKNEKYKELNKKIKTEKTKIETFTNKEENTLNFRNKINEIYRNTKTTNDFIKVLNDNDIEIVLTKRKNGGGISFTSEKYGVSMAGGKVSSFLTYGKIKNNDPKLFAILNGDDDYISLTCENTPNKDYKIKIDELNKNYKQTLSDNGDTFIYYGKKDIEKYPNNYNIKISKDKNKISLGQKTNHYDLKLVYDLAKKSGWANGKSNSETFIKDLMKISYKENKEDLLLFSTYEKSLKISDIKEIIKDDTLSTSNLIKLYDNNIIIDEDKDKLKSFVIEQLKEKGEDITIITKILDDKQSLKLALDKDNPIRIKTINFREEQKKRERQKEQEYKEIQRETRIQRPTNNKSNSPYKVDKPSPFNRR